MKAGVSEFPSSCDCRNAANVFLLLMTCARKHSAHHTRGQQGEVQSHSEATSREAWQMLQLHNGCSQAEKDMFDHLRGFLTPEVCVKFPLEDMARACQTDHGMDNRNLSFE